MQKSSEEINITPELQNQIDELTRGCMEVLPKNEFIKKLYHSYTSQKPLVVKAGFDPTAPDLHLGHTVLLQKMRMFQKFGHSVKFLIGDYTALIGDPSGRSETRKPLSQEQVLKNAETYKDQVFKILDEQKTEVMFNSVWLKKLDLKNVIELTSKYTVARLLERDDFSKRYNSGEPISLVEFMYPLMQGYDSVAMDADVELGGNDQKFNLLVGRDLQLSYGQKQQVILTMPLLVGLDGVKKMSKSYGNYIGIQEPPLEIFGKLMSISDDLMWGYYELLSDLSLAEIENLKNQCEQGEVHPKEAKAKLALELITKYYNSQEAENAQKEWQTIHAPGKRGLPQEIPQWQAQEKDLNEGKIGLLNALKLSGMAASTSEAKRHVEGGGAYFINEEDESENKIEDFRLTLESGIYLVRLGKRKFIRIVIP